LVRGVFRRLLRFLGAAVLADVALKRPPEPAFEHLGVFGLYKDAAPLLEAYQQPRSEGELEYLHFRDILEEHVADSGSSVDDHKPVRVYHVLTRRRKPTERRNGQADDHDERLLGQNPNGCYREG